MTLNLYLFGLEKPSSKDTSTWCFPIFLGFVGFITIDLSTNFIKETKGYDPPPF
jgi:hypothetical protein